MKVSASGSGSAALNLERERERERENFRKQERERERERIDSALWSTLSKESMTPWSEGSKMEVVSFGSTLICRIDLIPSYISKNRYEKDSCQRILRPLVFSICNRTPLARSKIFEWSSNPSWTKHSSQELLLSSLELWAIMVWQQCH